MQWDRLSKTQFILGNATILDDMANRHFEPFSDKTLEFLDLISSNLRNDLSARTYSDVQTFAIWARKTALIKMRESYGPLPDRLGRGTTFHIAPSNIPVMFMFSFAVSLLAGNPNIIRLSSKDFSQTPIILNAIENAIEVMPEMRFFIVIVRYGHDKEITDYFSRKCRSRMIWGGNSSIRQIRASELPVTGIDLPFYDRFSFSIIDSDGYLEYESKDRLAERFYNDTYLTDQNACTSPQLVVWTGNKKAEARMVFWTQLEKIVKNRYEFQSVQSIDKLAAAARLGTAGFTGKMIYNDMKLVRIELSELPGKIKDYRCPGGYFYEYLCDDLYEIKDVCGTDTQTISYFGLRREDIVQFLRSTDSTGADRIVPIGATMNFGTKWDGFDFIYNLSRVIA